MEEVHHLISSEIMNYVSKEKGFKSCEQISRFALLDESFKVGKELSAKQEVKRSEIHKLYKDKIESIYR